MAATFSVAQQYGSGAGSTSLLGATGSLWNFKQATNPGTANYNSAGSNIPAGQNSFGLNFRPYFSTNATNTFSNIRFYQSTTWTNSNYAAVGTSAAGYTQSTGSSTAGTNGGGSNVGVPTGSATNAAIALGTLTLGSASGYGPTYLKVQLTTGASAPAGDKQRSVSLNSANSAKISSRKRRANPKLFWEMCRDYTRDTLIKCEEIVRTIQRCMEVGRNDQLFAFARITES